MAEEEKKDKTKDNELHVVDDEKNKEEEIVPEILNKMPTKIKETFAMMSSGRMFNPLAEKIETQHIDKILDMMKVENDNEFNFAKKSKNFELFYFLLFVGLFLFLTFYLAKDDVELFKQIVQIGVGFIGGLGGGYYLKSRKEK